jgi:serine protease Do
MGKGRLGLMLMGLTPELRQHFGATSSSGILVARVEPDSPAAKAGVRVGDVLTTANAQAVDDAMDVRAAIAGTKKGATVELGIIRDRKPVTLKAVLGEEARSPSPTIESFWSKEWFRNFMKPFEELKEQSHAPEKS